MFIFQQVHKAASTTLYNIFVRFATSRNLKVMFPAQSNVLNQEGPNPRTIIPHPPSPPFKFDILCNHIIFNRIILRRYLPTDSKLVAILREPLDQVRKIFDPIDPKD